MLFGNLRRTLRGIMKGNELDMLDDTEIIFEYWQSSKQMTDDFFQQRS